VHRPQRLTFAPWRLKSLKLYSWGEPRCLIGESAVDRLWHPVPVWSLYYWPMRSPSSNVDTKVWDRSIRHPRSCSVIRSIICIKTRRRDSKNICLCVRSADASFDHQWAHPNLRPSRNAANFSLEPLHDMQRFDLAIHFAAKSWNPVTGCGAIKAFRFRTAQHASGQTSRKRHYRHGILNRSG
jgi:hypothetical protein